MLLGIGPSTLVLVGDWPINIGISWGLVNIGHCNNVGHSGDKPQVGRTSRMSDFQQEGSKARYVLRGGNGTAKVVNSLSISRHRSFLTLLNAY